MTVVSLYVSPLAKQKTLVCLLADLLDNEDKSSYYEYESNGTIRCFASLLFQEKVHKAILPDGSRYSVQGEFKLEYQVINMKLVNRRNSGHKSAKKKRFSQKKHRPETYHMSCCSSSKKDLQLSPNIWIGVVRIPLNSC